MRGPANKVRGSVAFAVGDENGQIAGRHPFFEVAVQNGVLMEGFFQPQQFAVGGFFQHGFGQVQIPAVVGVNHEVCGGGQRCRGRRG